MVDQVRFNNITYRRYPNSPYFTAGISDRQGGASYLHRDIWISAHGPIPDGHDVHHIDFDPSNNDLENLQILTVSDHQALHTAHRRATGAYRTPKRLAHVDRIRPLTKAWHASEEGRAWHVQHGIEAYAKREPATRQCDHCSAAYNTLGRRSQGFCSNNCKSAARRASGVDDVDKACPVCKSTFKASRYSKAEHCSRKCAWRTRAARA